MLTSGWQWIQANDALLWWFGSISASTFIGTLVLVPVLVARIPADYFVREHSPSGRLRESYPAARLLGLMLKNLLGLVLVLAGIAMMVLPGQGILTILIGLMLMNFPGKYQLERRIVLQPAVLRAINWVRAKVQRPPLQAPARAVLAERYSEPGA